MTELVDVVVLGMGPGGEEVAGRLAEAGLDVVGVDAALVGGECPYWGCVPSKMMIRAANVLTEGRRIPGMAGTADVRADWRPVATRVRDEATDNWDDTVAVERFEKKGGRLVRGHGTLTAPDVVEVAGQAFQARRAVVLATGSSPSAPPIPGLADSPYWTNHHAIEAAELPASMVILGGGAIGAELAQVFARFGVAVTLIESGPQLLPSEEPEVGLLLAEVFRREGIDVLIGANAAEVEHTGEQFVVRLAGGQSLRSERLLVATGRRVDLDTIGADVLGVGVTARAIPVDEHMRVADHVWAVGDITGKGAFTHTAMYQAAIVVADILGTPHVGADYRAVPRVTFTDPEVGSVGLSAQQAADAGLDVLVGRADVPRTSRGWIHKSGNDGVITLVADAKRDVLVGATVMSPCGGEVIAMLTLAVHASVPVDQLQSMIYAYPTFHRGVEDALKNLSPFPG